MNAPCRVTADLNARERDYERRENAFDRYGLIAEQQAMISLMHSSRGGAWVSDAVADGLGNADCALIAHHLAQGDLTAIGVMIEKIVADYCAPHLAEEAEQIAYGMEDQP